MKYLLLAIILLAMLSCEKQENPTQKEVDTLNLKNGENGNFINIEIDSTSIDTVVIRISE